MWLSIRPGMTVRPPGRSASFRRRERQSPDWADRHDAIALDGHGLSDREAIVDGDNLPVGEDQIREVSSIEAPADNQEHARPAHVTRRRIIKPSPAPSINHEGHDDHEKNPKLLVPSRPFVAFVVRSIVAFVVHSVVLKPEQSVDLDDERAGRQPRKARRRVSRSSL